MPAIIKRSLKNLNCPEHFTYFHDTDFNQTGQGDAVGEEREEEVLQLPADQPERVQDAADVLGLS